MKEKDFKFKWEEKSLTPTEPSHGDLCVATIPVKVIFEFSDKIVADVDEYNNPVEYKSGYIMRVLPDQSFVYQDEAVFILGHTHTEK